MSTPYEQWKQKESKRKKRKERIENVLIIIVFILAIALVIFGTPLLIEMTPFFIRVGGLQVKEAEIWDVTWTDVFGVVYDVWLSDGTIESLNSHEDYAKLLCYEDRGPVRIYYYRGLLGCWKIERVEVLSNES